MVPIRIVLAQINPTVGAIGDNTRLIRDVIVSLDKDVDLVVFPEGALPGYPAQDLVLDPSFIDDLDSALRSIANEVGDFTAIIGTVRSEKSNLYNTAAVLRDRKIVEYRDKSLLPTYDVFSEARYFTPSDNIKPLSLDTKSGDSVSIGLHICEDMWDDNYPTKVCDLLAAKGVDLLLNISASPYRVGIDEEREGIVIAKATKHKVPYLYCNLVGGQDDLIFDGRSLIVGSSGEIVRQAKIFSTDLITVQFPLDMSSLHQPAKVSREIEIARALEIGIQDYFRKTGHTAAYLGLSGGIDSALVAVLAVNALGREYVHGIIMPSTFNSPQSAEDAETTARNLGCYVEAVSIESLRQEVLEQLSPLFKDSAAGLAEENLQARLRGLLLMALANKHGALVLTTGNKTEIALGYATLYGDMAGALAPVGDLSKNDVYAVAKALNEEAGREIIPRRVIEKAPSAELRHNQTDPFDYARIAPLVERLISRHEPLSALVEDGYSVEEIGQFRQMIRRSEHKRRQSAPVIRVTGKAFGTGRRYPIVNGHE